MVFCGAIDGMHIEINSSKEKQDSYIWSIGHYSEILQAIVDTNTESRLYSYTFQRQRPSIS